MPKAWNIIARTRPKDGKPGQAQYFIVAIDHRETALAVLQSRKELAGAEFEIAGETSPGFMEWAGGIKPGQILCVVAME